MVDYSPIFLLPDEVLIKIFEFCDLQSLGRLSSTCQKFKHLVYSEESCWRDKSRIALGSNMFSLQMQQRSKPFLSHMKRCEVSLRWRKGFFRRSIIREYNRCLPWICLDQQFLCCSKERFLVQYHRKKDGNVSFNDVNWFVPHSDDVAKFVLNENEVITAGRDGSLARWKKGNLRPIHTIMAAHHCDMLCVDAKTDIIITGSKDLNVKIWKAHPRNTVFEKEINMGARVLSVAIMPSNRFYVVGLTGTNNKHPLQLFDFEKNEPITNMGSTFRNGAGILDIYPENENTFLCCGYDTTVKLWDLRSPQQCVGSWMDPFDNGIYCVTSDHHVTIVSGASRNGVVHIWDKRRPGLQFLHQSKKFNSPAYSVAFDASHLFVAYDQALMQLSYL